MDKADCEALRRQIKAIAEKLPPMWKDNNEEAGMNVLLAYRHLEDAGMRLGKAIQALDGGVSVYDISQVPRSA